MTTKTLGTPRIEGRGQTVDYIEHLLHNKSGYDNTLRIHIHDDSHARQAWAHVERWDGTRWHEVVTMNGEAFALEHGIGYRVHEPAAHDFKTDRDRLLALALEVL